jgi:hypothetical protein
VLGQLKFFHPIGSFRSNVILSIFFLKKNTVQFFISNQKAKMFALAKSILNTVLGRKRPLEDEDDHQEQQQVETKKQKLEMLHRVKVTNLPEREISTVKKYFTGLGYKRIKKAPEWDFAFIAIDVSCLYIWIYHVTRVI